MFSYKYTYRQVYRRLYKTCSRLPYPVSLTKAKKLAKRKIWESSSSINPDAAFIDVDFLLNIAKLSRASIILSNVKAALKATHLATLASQNTLTSV